MSRTVAQKLSIKPGDKVFFGPSTAELRGLIDPLSEDVTVLSGSEGESPDVVIMFAHDRKELDSLLSVVAPTLVTPAPRAIWVGYPKGNRSDINRDSIWSRVQDFGWTLNGNISLSDVWSSVRMKRAE